MAIRDLERRILQEKNKFFQVGTFNLDGIGQYTVENGFFDVAPLFDDSELGVLEVLPGINEISKEYVGMALRKKNEFSKIEFDFPSFDPIIDLIANADVFYINKGSIEFALVYDEYDQTSKANIEKKLTHMFMQSDAALIYSFTTYKGEPKVWVEPKRIIEIDCLDLFDNKGSPIWLQYLEKGVQVQVGIEDSKPVEQQFLLEKSFQNFDFWSQYLEIQDSEILSLLMNDFSLLEQTGFKTYFLKNVSSCKSDTFITHANILYGLGSKLTNESDYFTKLSMIQEYEEKINELQGDVDLMYEYQDVFLKKIAPFLSMPSTLHEANVVSRDIFLDVVKECDLLTSNNLSDDFRSTLSTYIDKKYIEKK